jgi:hypothetical protein
VNQPTATRGRPLLVLVSILGAWLVGRVLFWNPLFPTTMISTRGAPATGIEPDAIVATGPEEFGSGQIDRLASALAMDLSASRFAGPAAAVPAKPPAKSSPPANQPDHSLVRRVTGPQMLLAAAFDQGSLPGLAAEPGPVAAQLPGRGAASRAMLSADRPLLGASAAPEAARPVRLSGDSWLLWRSGSAIAGPPGGATYGRSQAGAVMRYRLLAGPVRLLEAYARATRTLEGSRQTEGAAGLSLRPLDRVPLTLAAEARVTDTASGRELRPAAFAVAQLPPIALPLGLRGEAYVQGGYVGGRFSTSFADGQARVDGRLVQFRNDDDLRLGLAAWGGAQEGAGRLDVGPSAALAFTIGDARVRIAADYRMRIAGGAAPDDGPAVTFSAGF